MSLTLSFLAYLFQILNFGCDMTAQLGQFELVFGFLIENAGNGKVDSSQVLFRVLLLVVTQVLLDVH